MFFINFQKQLRVLQTLCQTPFALQQKLRIVSVKMIIQIIYNSILFVSDQLQIKVELKMIQGFVSKEALALIFMFFGLTIAVIIRKLRSMYSWIPYTPTLFLVSVGLGLTCQKTGIIGQSIKQISLIDPHGILLIFLPPLIFESSFNSDWYIFRKQSVQIFILAFPAVLVGALIIMFSIKMVIGYEDDYYNWPEAFMFGSVLSCTDTVAVLALLKEAGAPRKFNSLIEGESLFNDGTCMVLYTISLELVKGNSPPPLKIVQLFLQLTVGAIVLGVVFGYISAQLIKKVRNDAILTLNLTVVSCYLLYFTAQYIDLGIKISGIMALVSMGLYMAAFGKTQIAHQAKQVIQRFWQVYIFIAETIIFILGGVLVGVQSLKPQFMEVFDTDNLKRLGFLYICMTLARFLSITVFMPKLQNEGYGLKWNEVGALTYGGLRGAVGIAFTLILASNHSLKPKFRMVSLMNTSGCAFLTLMINAPTCSAVIKKLGLCVKSDTKVRFFRKFLKQCQSQILMQLEDMTKNKHLNNSNWQKVKQQCGLPELKLYIDAATDTLRDRGVTNIERQRAMSSLSKSLVDHSLDNVHEADEGLISEIRNRFCVALKGILWEKFSNNQCSNESIHVLIECVNIDTDSIDEPLNSWDYLISHMHNPYFFPICYWLKTKPFIGSYAYSWIYDRVKLLYDVISTYLDALVDCQQACKSFPYDQYLQAKVIQQSKINRKLAQSFLDHQIKISYFQIMKRIQTTKAAQSILTFSKSSLQESHSYGQIEDEFFKQLEKVIDDSSNKLQYDSQVKKDLSDLDIIKQTQFFHQLSDLELNKILVNKVNLLVQKDQPVLKSYEKQKYVYLVVRGEIIEEYKNQTQAVYRRNVGLYQLSGVGTILINRRTIGYSAVAQSVVSLFCFPINEIKQLVARNQKLQQILQKDNIMLEIRLEPDIVKTFDISYQDLRKRKNIITYKRLSKGETYQVQDAYLVLIFGKLKLEDKTQSQGCFKIRDKATIQGPAKLYYCSLTALQEQEKKSQMYAPIRASTRLSKQGSRLSGAKYDSSSIIRRTIYGKD